MISKKWVSTVLSILFLFLLFRQFSHIRWSDVSQVMTQVNFVYLSAGLGVMFSSTLLRAVRWRLILLPIKKFSVFRVLESLLTGYWFNAILPGHAGELGRCFHFSKKQNVSFATVLGTIAVERLSDVAALLLLIFTGALFIWLKVELNFAEVSFFLMTLVVFFLLFYFRKHPFLAGLSRQLPDNRWTRFFRNLVNRTYSSARFISGKNVLPAYSIYTMLIWTTNIVSYWFIILACHLPPFLKSLSAAFSVTVAGVSTQAIAPSASGGGLFCYGIVAAFQHYADVMLTDVTQYESSIFATSLVIFISLFVHDIALGGFFYFKDREIFGDFSIHNK